MGFFYSSGSYESEVKRAKVCVCLCVRACVCTCVCVCAYVCSLYLWNRVRCCFLLGGKLNATLTGKTLHAHRHTDARTHTHTPVFDILQYRGWGGQNTLSLHLYGHTSPAGGGEFAEESRRVSNFPALLIPEPCVSVKITVQTDTDCGFNHSSEEQ